MKILDIRNTCLEQSQTPLVVKPLDGNQGRGVSLNLSTPAQISEGFDAAVRVSRAVIVEEMLRGLDYRVVVVNGRMAAAAQRHSRARLGRWTAYDSRPDRHG